MIPSPKTGHTGQSWKRQYWDFPQRIKQLKPLIGQYRLLSLYRPPALLGEYGQTSDVNGLGTYFLLVFQQPLMNLDMRAYPGHQLCEAEELYQIVVRIQAHPLDFIHMLSLGCYHEDWKMQLLPDFPTNLKTAFSGSITSRILLAPSTFAVLWEIESFSANTNFIRICSVSPQISSHTPKVHDCYT